MNPDSLSGLLLIIALILLRGLIVLAYSAFANLRQSIVRDLADEGHIGARRLLPLLEKSSDLQVTYGVATTLLSTAISAVAILGFANPLIAQFGESTSAMTVYTGVLLIVVLLTLIFGELVPEGIGSSYASTLSMSLARFMQVLIVLLKPLTVIVVSASKAIATLFKSSEKVNRVTEEEIVTLVESGQAGGSIEEEEKDMILSVLQLDQTYASEVMVPRIDITALEIETSLETALATFIKSGFSRIPLYENTIDNIKGLLYAKDLLNHWHNGNKEKALEPRDLMRPAYLVPETKRADDLLKELQTKRVHMAVVIDEFGGTAGIVTIENIIEEIIGDIQDEHDPFEEAEYVEESRTQYLVDASMDIDDFNDLLHVEVPGDDSDTLGGFVYTTLGRVPVIGEEIRFEDSGKRLVFRVEKVEGRRIRKVRVFVHTTDEEAEVGQPRKTDTSETAATAVTAVTPATPPSPDIDEIAEVAATIGEEPVPVTSVTAPVTLVTAPAISDVTVPPSDAVPRKAAETNSVVKANDGSSPTAASAAPSAATQTTAAPSDNAEAKTVIPTLSEAPPSSNAVAVTLTDTSQAVEAASPAADVSPEQTHAVGESASRVSDEADSTAAKEAIKAEASDADLTDSDSDTSSIPVGEDTEDGTQPDKPRQPVSERP